MIVSESAALFAASAVGPPGLVGTIGTRILRPDGTPVSDRSTDGITELLDGDPPAPSGFYSLERAAPTLQGRYTLLWDTGTVTPQTMAAEELVVALHGQVAIGAAEYAPTVAEVAAYIRARTKDPNGVELGTFTADTRPTDAEVTTIIQNAAGKVAARFGDTVAAPLAFAAREVVALRAAMIVELSFFGDQIQAGRSPYTELKDLYEENYQQLLDARLALGADLLAGTDDDTSAAGLPSFAFPPFGLCRTPSAEIPGPYMDSPYWPYTCGGAAW